MGALYFLKIEFVGKEEMKVKKFIIDGEWDRQKLTGSLSEEMVTHIIENISPSENDTPWWMVEVSGRFSVRFAYKIMRSKREE